MAELKSLSASVDSSENGSEKLLLREVAYKRLKNAIRDGDLQPGDPLFEIHLSEKLNISRTPVREALQQLVLEGLVKNMPNRAMTVAAPSMEELLNVLHIRSLVDPEVARLVAGAATTEVVQLLEATVERMEQAAAEGNRKDWSRADSLFHETMGAACPNVLLGQLSLQMRNRTQLAATDAKTSSPRLVECTKEHIQVIEAIANRDADKAKEAMQRHIELQRESLFKRMMHI